MPSELLAGMPYHTLNTDEDNLHGNCCRQEAPRIYTEFILEGLRHKCCAVDLYTILGRITDFQSTFEPKKSVCGVRFRFSNVVPGIRGL